MLNDVLETCRYVANNSQFVSVDKQRVEEVAKELNNGAHWLESSPYGLLDYPTEDLVNFWLIYISIGGFSFWGKPKWTVETEEGALDGAFAIMYILIHQLKKDKSFLQNEKLSFDEFAKLLDGNVEIPLLKQRYDNFIYINEQVAENMNGNFYNYIKDIHTDTELFDVIIEQFPRVFVDKATYKGKGVYFFKLAQLLVSDILHIRQIKENIPVDYSHLVGCADYKIPQVLRNLGILVYSKELSDIIDNGVEIDAGSNYEVEIRANTIVAINALNDRIKDACPIETNDSIWLKGQDKSQNPKPYHLTRTRYY